MPPNSRNRLPTFVKECPERAAGTSPTALTCSQNTLCKQKANMTWASIPVSPTECDVRGYFASCHTTAPDLCLLPEPGLLQPYCTESTSTELHRMLGLYHSGSFTSKAWQVFYRPCTHHRAVSIVDVRTSQPPNPSLLVVQSST